MGVAELNKEFEGKNIIHFKTPAQTIFIDACIYWEWILPKETEFAENTRTTLATEPEFRRKICFDFFKYIFQRLISCEISAIDPQTQENPMVVNVIFDNSSCRPWLKWSKCIQRRRQQENLTVKKIRFHPSIKEMEDLWSEYPKAADWPEKYVNINFQEAPRDTDDCIFRSCKPLISDNMKLRDAVVDDLLSTNRKVVQCSPITIFSSDSDFLSFFPFSNIVNVCHGETWNCDLQITRLLNYSRRETEFWKALNLVSKDLSLQIKLACFKTYVISRGHNDYMTCTLHSTKISWQDYFQHDIVGLLDIRQDENIDIAVFFNYLYFIHLDVNLTALKFKQIVGNALRLFVADPPSNSLTDGETWTHIELASSVSNSVNRPNTRILLTLEELYDFFQHRIDIITNTTRRDALELDFKKKCTQNSVKNTVNISNALNEWYSYFCMSYQNHVSRNTKRPRVEATKWPIFHQLNQLFFKALVLFYISLFKVWFIDYTVDVSSNISAFDIFLRRIYQLVCLGNDVEQTLEIKDRDLFYSLLKN